MDSHEPPNDPAPVFGKAPHEQESAAAEQQVAATIDPPGRWAMVVAIAVAVLLASFLLPHTGVANGWEVLVGAPDSSIVSIKIASRVFVWLALVFGCVMSWLALVTRRWAVAWTALAGCAVSCAFGLFAIWSRQTLPSELAAPGPGFGLVLALLSMVVLTFHWLKIVWYRSMQQLESEQRRRAAAHEREQTARRFLERDTPCSEQD